MVTYSKKEFKSILNKRKFIDGWFWDRYGINGYNGCMHGCIYCDFRSQKYYLPEDFSNNIIVKKNVKEMLDKRISNARILLADIVGMSGASDPYHPAEATFKNTLQCLEVLEKHNWPVHIITKSKLVLRDLELLETIGKNNWCTISITITTTNPEIATFLEPRVGIPSDRFDIIRTIKQKTKQIQTGVLLIPTVPYLSDSDEDLEKIVNCTKESGADYLLFGGSMTMRDIQASYFLKHLIERFPPLVNHYEELYQFKYLPDLYDGNYNVKRGYNLRICKKLFAMCEKYNLPYRIKRFIPADYRKVNYIISEKLLNKAYKLQMLGKVWTNIHWAGMNIQNLKESITDISKRNELQQIRNVNDELAEFIINEITNC